MRQEYSSNETYAYYLELKSQYEELQSNHDIDETITLDDFILSQFDQEHTPIEMEMLLDIVKLRLVELGISVNVDLEAEKKALYQRLQISEPGPQKKRRGTRVWPRIAAAVAVVAISVAFIGAGNALDWSFITRLFGLPTVSDNIVNYGELVHGVIGVSKPLFSDELDTLNAEDGNIPMVSKQYDKADETPGSIAGYTVALLAPPMGYEFVSATINETYNVSTMTSQYTDGTNELLMMAQVVHDQDYKGHAFTEQDKQEAIHTRYQGIDLYLVDNNNYTCLFFNMDSCAYQLWGDVPESALFAFAELIVGG